MKIFTIKNIEIEIVERIDSISAYNHNYYKIKPSCGDYYDFYDNDVIYVESEDDTYLSSVYVGKIVNEKFVPAFMITHEEEW